MRCPKCGYISFDHLENCLKCGKEVKKAADELHGTVFNVAPPSFLKFEVSEPEETDSDFEDQFEGDIDMDAIDPDLDILLDDEEPEIEADGLSALGDLSDDAGFEITDDLDDSQDDDISIDFNQFEDAEIDGQEEEGTTEVDLDLPDELTDISDLEPQMQEEEPIAEVAAESTDSFADLGSDDFDLDLNLGGLGDEEEPAAPATPPAVPEAVEEELSLDLDMSLDEEESKPKATANMDDDLNFDLDLGGLSLDK